MAKRIYSLSTSNMTMGMCYEVINQVQAKNLDPIGANTKQGRIADLTSIYAHVLSDQKKAHWHIRRVWEICLVRK